MYRPQGGPEKNALSLMHCNYAAVCSRITWFSPNTEKRSLSTSQCNNLCHLVNYSLINSQNRIHVTSNITLHANMTPLTVEGQLLKEDTAD